MKALLGAYVLGVFGVIAVIGLLAGCETQLSSYRYDGAREKRLLAETLGGAPAETGLVMLALNDEIRADLDSRISQNWSAKRKLRELRAYLYGEDELNISYDARVTKGAIDAYESRATNCLGLTSLFIATSRYVGIDAHFQKVKVRPSWDYVGNTMIRYQHIVATGNLPGESYVMDFLPNFRIDGRQTRRISDRAALALFYNNLGAENVVLGNLEEAIVDLRKALALDPELTDAWNNMGAAWRRLRREDLAEFSYHRALRLRPNNYSALSNLMRFYNAAGRAPEAEEVRSKVDRYRRLNPYFYYSIAKILYQEGNYIDAIAVMSKAIRLKRDEPEFYDTVALIFAAIDDGPGQRKYQRLAEKYQQGTFVQSNGKFENNRLLVIKNH